jgi:integrase
MNGHTWQSGFNDGKLDPGFLKDPATQPPKQPKLTCPECGSKKLYRDGLRYLKDGTIVQRWLCRSCSYRFSEPRSNPASHGEKPSRENMFNAYLKHDMTVFKANTSTLSRQVCASKHEAKNLNHQRTRKKQAAGATKTDPETTKGLITKFMAYLDKEGYRTTAYLNLIRLLAIRGADLLDPEDVKEKLAKQPWKDSVKLVAVSAYKVFAKVHNLQWTPPRYKPEDTLPFVPEESELDQLIATCKSQRMAAYLQTLKETSTDPTEALRIEWIDKDDKNRIISIRHPVKGHDARQRKISGNLIAMLNALPKTEERIFATNYTNMETCFLRVRKRAAKTLQNPRLLKISFKTFRHWGGSMIAHYTHGNVLAVKRALGHKRIENTMKYIHMLHFKDNEFDVATATSVEDVKKLAAAGFEKIDEIQGIHVFRRPKRFGA